MICQKGDVSCEAQSWLIKYLVRRQTTFAHGVSKRKIDDKNGNINITTYKWDKKKEKAFDGCEQPSFKTKILEELKEEGIKSVTKKRVKAKALLHRNHLSMTK